MIPILPHSRLLPLATFFLGSFLLNLLWENVQAPLFRGYESFAQHFPICLKATATGDMLFIFTIYLCLAMVHRDWQWLRNPLTYRHPATWLLPIIIGLLLATSFELWAVHAAHRWQYTNSMPLIPLLQIGLTPILQMIVIPTIVLLLTKFTLPSFLPSPRTPALSVY